MQETRQTILNILKEHGQVTVDQLSDRLRLTTVTIRHHLDVLRSEGFVNAPQVRRRHSPGRPEYVYTLTAQASDCFPKNYVNFADLMLLEVRERAGGEETASIARNIGRRMAADAPLPSPGESWTQRLDRVVEFLNEKGYVARWERAEVGYLLHTANCPYPTLARRHTEPCLMDLALVAELVGVMPQRVCWMAAGDATCTYCVAAPRE